jgi:hypothetical protein
MRERKRGRKRAWGQHRERLGERDVKGYREEDIAPSKHC